MFDFNKLMAISESATGFNGGSMVDEMPEYTLDECMNTLPMVIMESQIEQYEINNEQNEIMVEAAISAANGMPADFDSLVEAGKTSLKESFMNFLNKVKSFVSSIIVKIKALWERRRGDANKMIAKYEKVIKADKCKDLVFKGYDFDKELNTKIDNNVSELIGNLRPEFSVLKGGLTSPSTDIEKLNAIKSVEASRMSMEIANKITGANINEPGDWVNLLQQYLFGYTDPKDAKHEIKFGEKCFTIDKVKKMLQNHNALQNLLNSYTVLQKDIDVQLRNCNNLKKHTEDNDENKDTLAYFDVYTTVYKNAAGAVNKVNAIVKRYIDAQWVQASQMWIAMARASGAKAEEPAEKEAPEAKPESEEK